MKIAVEGCAHGELEKIYETIQGIEREQNIKIDLLICCGDFQSTRNLSDLQTMAVPKKFQDMCTFYKYYSGELLAPILTIFIGGNHEASNYLQELPYGGWVAPNIYYLGYAGVVRVNGIRIGGLSGIYKGHDYLRGRFEFAPYTDQTCRSVYHVRQLEVFRLKQLSGKMDIMLSHDWPRGIYNYGNKAQLVRFKPHFRNEVDNDQLGSRPCEDLLKLLKPTMWFAAHLHCKFAAVVPHNECEADDDGEDAEERVTKFLALDKCLPKRRFLQVLEIASTDHTDDGEICFEYDLEWLAILYLTNHLINTKHAYYYLPGSSGNSEERFNFTPTDEELAHVRLKFGGDLRIPENFSRTVEAYDPQATNSNQVPQPKAQINPQSMQFCDALGIDDPLSLAMLISGHELSHSSTLDGSDVQLSDCSALMPGNEQLSLNSTCADASSLQQASPLKRKSSLGLNLPKPNIQTDNTPPVSPDDKVLTDNPEVVQLNDSSADEADAIVETPDAAVKADESTMEVPDTPIANPPIKKFKRRNQELYKEPDEEGTETAT